MKYFFTAILILTISVTNAQKISLKVIPSAGKSDSLTGATVTLRLLPDSNLIATQAAGAKGAVFSVDPLSKYIVKISAVGFSDVEQTVSVTDKPISINVPLKKAVQGLSSVVIVSRKPLVKQEDDKTIVDAEALANTSSNAYEVLEKTPGAIVDQDGNVYLSSMSPAMIQINGREIKLSAADLAALLKSLPAGSVSKIEILRSPSAKYDAASSGGIVNIVLKKGVKIGASGSMNVGYFKGRHSTKTAGFNLNKGDDKVSSYMSYQFTERNNYETINSTRLLSSDNAYLSQAANTTYPSTNHHIGLGTDVTFSKKFNVSYDLRISASDNRSDALNLSQIIGQGNGIVKGVNSSSITNRGTSTYIGNNLSSKLKIDSLGSEWTVQVDYDHFKYNNEQLYNNYYYLPAANSLLGNGNTTNTKSILTVQSDFTLKLKYGITLEAGVKSIASGSNNAAAYFFKTGNSGLQPDQFQTNTFKYNENINSAYLQLSKTFFGFTLKPGLRLENTNIEGRQIIPKDTSLSIKRTDLFPYVYLRHRIAKLFGFELNANAIFRKSITRPYYEILNPYPKYVDQYLFDTGNPNLQPQFTNNYEFNITADDFTIFSVGINDTKNIFGNVTYQDDATGIAYRTYDNLGKSKEVYLRFVGGIPPGGKYSFYAGAQQNFNSYDGFYQGLPLSYKRSSWVFFMYQNYKITPTLNVTANGFMRLKGLQNFYELNSFGSLNISFNKSILSKKGNLILSCNDVLRTNRTTFMLDQGNVSATGRRYGDTRRVGLTFRYNFGIKPKPEAQQGFGAPVE